MLTSTSAAWTESLDERAGMTTIPSGSYHEAARCGRTYARSIRYADGVKGFGHVAIHRLILMSELLVALS